MLTNSVYWIWFQLVFGIGTRRAELFLQYYEHPGEIYEGIERRSEAYGMLEKGELTSSGPSMELAGQILRKSESKGCEVVTPDHAAYPKQLQGIYSKPAALYVRGDLSCLDRTLAVAMVGSRKHSEYGKEAAARFARELAEEGAVVVSGLAPGIDTESHRAALSAGGKTVGVLGCGIDVDYPKESREIKTAVSKNGAVVTEYPLGTQPLPMNFPMRNRIISGMSHGILVVEAGMRSGSLITARLAREQGREVFAVPGSIFARGEQGTHRLIKEGARLADCGADILEQYTDLIRRKPRAGKSVLVKEKRAPMPDDSPDNRVEGAEPTEAKEPGRKARGKVKTERQPGRASLPEGLGEPAAGVYAAFPPERMTVDDLAVRTGLPTGELLTALTELEIYGLVVCHPGRRFGLSE